MRLAGYAKRMGAIRNAVTISVRKGHGFTVLKFLGGQVANVWTVLDADSVHSRFF
jgi:hypothetical protein